jgi:Cys-tRNA(Pro) deacylase
MHPNTPRPNTQHPNTRRVIAAGRSVGIAVAVRTFPEGTKTAADAAAAIGVEVGQIVKSLVFTIDGAPVVALVSGANQLDERRLAAEAGGAKCQRADADLVRAATGYPIGGVPPFGHAQELPVYIDRDLLGYGEVWAAAGTWNDVFPIDPEMLVRATGAAVADIRRA